MPRRNPYAARGPLRSWVLAENYMGKLLVHGRYHFKWGAILAAAGRLCNPILIYDDDSKEEMCLSSHAPS